jgi:2-polyprenyl-3-methyl-5-hydroxy-6-metoxy-1,4-benzoquinol methylase
VLRRRPAILQRVRKGGGRDAARAAARLLDIGIGRGAIAVPAQARGYRVTATDASAAMVARLAAEHPELDVRRMDAAELRFAGGTFDVVTAGFVLHLLDDRPSVIAAVRTLLTPGGLLAFTTAGGGGRCSPSWRPAT